MTHCPPCGVGTPTLSGMRISCCVTEHLTNPAHILSTGHFTTCSDSSRHDRCGALRGLSVWPQPWPEDTKVTRCLTRCPSLSHQTLSENTPGARDTCTGSVQPPHRPFNSPGAGDTTVSVPFTDRKLGTERIRKATAQGRPGGSGRNGA